MKVLETHLVLQIHECDIIDEHAILRWSGLGEQEPRPSAAQNESHGRRELTFQDRLIIQSMA
jgi:hypothetical protein